MSGFRERAASVLGRIQRACARCGRDPASVELLAVSKHQPLACLQEACAAGFATFGENYVQEGVAKAQELPDASFALIGPLQRNKAKPALTHFTEIMTLDRPDLALRLGHVAQELDVVRPIWIQVDLWQETTKQGGCPEAHIQDILDALAEDVRLPLQGFMAIPPPHMPDAFAQMAELRERWQQRLGQTLRLSMGMSEDLEAAILAGSDQVRVGTDLFGERHQ